MKKILRWLLLPMMAIIFLFLVGCTSQTSNIENQSGSTVLNDCFSKIDDAPGESYVQYQQDLCRLNSAKESRDRGTCLKIKNENKQAECVKYFEDLPFAEGTSTDEDVLKRCKCDSYCYGSIYIADCIYKNVRTPQQCLSFMGLHYENSISDGSKIYFEEENLNVCLKGLISRTNNSSFCEESPQLYFNFCDLLEKERIKEEKFQRSISTMHVMTDDRDKYITNDLDQAHRIIEEWKKEGYKNFRIIDCAWDEEFEVCIDSGNGCVEGNCSNIKLNRHLNNRNLSSDFYKKHYELLDPVVCETPPEEYITICERRVNEESEKEKARISVATMHVMTNEKDVWVGDNINEGKRIIEEWKKEGHQNFRIFSCSWDSEFEVCIDNNAVYDEGDQSKLECNRHLRTLNLGNTFEKKYPGVLAKIFC